MNANASYRGRFAPSPTGPLHFGSLVTALASYLEARYHQGVWLLRIEDLDPLRQPADASDKILHSLNAHGLFSDEPIRFQSQRHSAYRFAVENLLRAGRAYFCRCSRKQLQAHNGQHRDHCRNAPLPDPVPWPPGDYALRFSLHSEQQNWCDLLLGEQQQNLTAEVDDPVLVRKEGFYAYQLAVVVDDIDQGITHVVRGSDLLAMTAAQYQVFQALAANAPQFLHIPVIRNPQGQKLSKQNRAPALDDTCANHNLVAALTALNQQPPASLTHESVAGILAWAQQNWQCQAITVPEPSLW